MGDMVLLEILDWPRPTFLSVLDSAKKINRDLLKNRTFYNALLGSGKGVASLQIRFHKKITNILLIIFPEYGTLLSTK